MDPLEKLLHFVETERKDVKKTFLFFFIALPLHKAKQGKWREEMGEKGAEGRGEREREIGRCPFVSPPDQTSATSA